MWSTAVKPSVPLIQKHEHLEEELKRLAAEALPDLSLLPHDLRVVVACIHHDLFDPALNAGAVKARCRIRNHNVSTRFRGAVGVGIREYIEALRLDAAGRLIVDSEVEIYLISMAVGYSHQETFCRAFQRHFGCSPSAYRDRKIKTKCQERTPAGGGGGCAYSASADGELCES